MTIFNKIAILGLSALALSGCMREDLDEVFTQSEIDSRTLTFSVEATTDTNISTKADGNNELTIHRGYIFFFSGDSYVGYEQIDLANVTGNGTSSLSILLKSENYLNKYNIIGVFNHCERLMAESFEGVTKTNISEYFPLDRTFLEEVEVDMNSETYAVGMPMFVNDFDDDNTTVHEIYRSLARLEICLSPSMSVYSDSGHTHDFNVDNVKMAILNDASVGNIGFVDRDDIPSDTSASTDAPINADEFDFESIEFDYTPLEYNAVTMPSTNKIYLYEFPYSTHVIGGTEIVDPSTFDPSRLAIMIEHADDSHPDETFYYKLNVVDQINRVYYDAARNHDYKIVITAVYTDGYDSIKEAYQMPPSNVEYEVLDLDGDVTVSNGQYAISMDEVISYDEIQLYTRGTTTLSFDNIHYIIPDVMLGNETIDVADLTNYVIFDISTDDSETLTIEVDNDFALDNKLTDQGKSITITLTGEGECTMALLIKLGNLEVGSSEITIKKMGEGGLGAFDAHPCQLWLDDQTYIDGTWQSADQDFGIRLDSSGSTVIYMGENATPTGYQTMDGYITSGAQKNAYPVFSDKSRTGYYSYLNEDGETVKTMISLDQLAPFYAGHFGSTASDTSLHLYDALIVEKVEEIESEGWWGISDYNGTILWGTGGSYSTIFYTGAIYGLYNGIAGMYRYLNYVDGYDISYNIVSNNTSESAFPTAAHYCYMKNDVNGDGRIDSSEPINWYLPAVNQMLSMWVCMHEFEEADDEYGFNEVSDNPYYWTCSEYSQDTSNNSPTSFPYVVMANMLEGEMITSGDKAGEWQEAHVRCVRGIVYGE